MEVRRYCEKSIIDISPDDVFKMFQQIGIFEHFPCGRFNTILEEDITAVSLSIVDRRTGMKWLYYKLRDRSLDGPTWTRTPLTSWPYRHKDDQFSLGRAVEQSRYFGNPDFPLEAVFGEEVAEFIRNPFEAIPFTNPTIGALKEWIDKWKFVFRSSQRVFPGSRSLQGIPGLAQHIFNSSLRLLRDKGYEYLTSVPTWFHIAVLNKKYGFSFLYPQDEAKFNKLVSRLPRCSLWRRSWIAVLQFWAELAEESGIEPEGLVDKEYIIRDENGRILTYPLKPERNLWQIYRL